MKATSIELLDQRQLSETLGDIRECDKEQIHLFASVQPHGCLVAFTWPDSRVQCASVNVQDYLGIPHHQVLGARLEHFLPAEFVEKIAMYVREHPWTAHGRYIELNDGMSGYLFHTEGLFCLEIEKAVGESKGGGLDLGQDVGDFMREVKNAHTIESLSQLTARAVRKVTGVDRVMIYKFLEQTWHGQVVGEDRVAKSHSYMGHRFPSSDIPRPARDLYLRNSLRFIPDVMVSDSEIKPSLNPVSRKTIDLSDSRLRSVSKIHLEYLRNMKVGASFSIAIVSEERLWGLIACHHLSDFHIERSKWVHCELISHAFSARAQALETLAKQNVRLKFQEGLQEAFEKLRTTHDPIDEFFRQHRLAENLFGATGIAYVDKKRVDFAGLTPQKSDLQSLAELMRARFAKENVEVIAFHELSSMGDLAQRIRPVACGVAAIAVPGVDDGVLMLFRPEIIQTITWGGDPRKQLEKKNFEGRINPRESFHAWEEVVRDRSNEWLPHELDGLVYLRNLVFEVLLKPQMLIKELSKK